MRRYIRGEKKSREETVLSTRVREFPKHLEGKIPGLQGKARGGGEQTRARRTAQKEKMYVFYSNVEKVPPPNSLLLDEKKREGEGTKEFSITQRVR